MNFLTYSQVRCVKTRALCVKSLLDPHGSHRGYHTVNAHLAYTELEKGYQIIPFLVLQSRGIFLISPLAPAPSFCLAVYSDISHSTSLGIHRMHVDLLRLLQQCHRLGSPTTKLCLLSLQRVRILRSICHQDSSFWRLRGEQVFWASALTSSGWLEIWNYPHPAPVFTGCSGCMADANFL